MYCKYCGQIIEEDSVFCKHCGQKMDGSNLESKDKDSNSIVSKFTSLSPNQQIAIIVYGIFALVWVCVLIGNASERHFAEKFVLPFFVCMVLLPSFLLCCLYVYKLKKNRLPTLRKENLSDITTLKNRLQNSISQKDNSDNSQKESPVVKTQCNSTKSKLILSSEPLLSFAGKHGKMQVVDRNVDNQDLREHYCLFTDSVGKTVKVEFCAKTETLSAKEISANKYQLCVTKYENGNYELAYINDKEIEDTLPF